MIVDPKLSGPLPVCCSVVFPSKVTGAPNVAPPPCVVLLPEREKLAAVIDKVPGVPVGPIVTPPKEKFPPAVKL